MKLPTQIRLAPVVLMCRAECQLLFVRMRVHHYFNYTFNYYPFSTFCCLFHQTFQQIAIL